MSRIDTPRSTAGAAISGSGERIVLGQRGPNGGLQQIAPSAGAPRNDYRPHRAFLPQPERDTALSPLSISQADLQPIAARGTDQLVADISRLLTALESALQTEKQPEARQSLEIGQTVLDDQLRRMQVLNAGYSALVMKW
jgi:hypothetical protein